MPEIPKEIEQKLMEFQQLQEQLQMVAGQKMQVKMQLDEIDSALSALNGATGKVFKSTGAIVVEANKDELSKELGEKKETLSVRMQVLAKQEDKLRKRLLEIKGEIEASSKGAKQSGG